MSYARKRMAAYRAGRVRRGFKSQRFATKRPRMHKRFRKGYDRSVGQYGRFKGSNLEMKFHDVDVTDAVVSSSGFIAAAGQCVIPQNTTAQGRIGRKCTIKWIGFKFVIDLPSAPSVTQGADVVRVMVIQDKQTNGIMATIASVLKTPDVVGFNNLDNKNRFRTLMDRVYQLRGSISGNGSAIDTGVDTVADQWYKKVNIPLEWNSTTGDISEMTSNNIFVLLISERGLCAFDGKIRLRYTNM